MKDSTEFPARAKARTTENWGTTFVVCLILFLTVMAVSLSMGLAVLADSNFSALCLSVWLCSPTFLIHRTYPNKWWKK